MTLHLLVTGVYVFDVLLNENLILSIHALLCSLLIYLRNFWSIVNFVSRLLHGFNWIARQSAIQNYAVPIKNRSRLDQVDVLLSILTSDSDHSSRIVPLMKKFKEWITPPNRVHSFFISSPSTPFWEFINSLFHSIYNYCHYITTWSCMLSFEKTCLITKFLHSNCKC